MFDDLPNQIPPIVGSYPFTGVPVVLGALEEEPEEESSEEIIQEEVVQEPAGRILADLLPDTIQDSLEKEIHLQVLEWRCLFQSLWWKKMMKPRKKEAYDDRGLPNVPPPVQNNRGIHTKIPSPKRRDTGCSHRRGGGHCNRRYSTRRCTT